MNSSFGKLKARMVIRDVGRVLGLAYGFVDSISKMIPFDPSRPQSLIECIAGEPRLQKLINEDPKVKKLTDLSLKLEGLNRNVATHAAGVVIADRKLTEVVPLYKDSDANLLLPLGHRGNHMYNGQAISQVVWLDMEGKEKRENEEANKLIKEC